MSTRQRLCLMICVFGLILSGASTARANSWQVVYETDFSSDPGWTTDQPQNFYWEAASGTYFIHQTNYPEAYEPDRYTFMRVPYYGGPFRLEWDLEMLRSDWSAGISIGLYDSNLRYRGAVVGSAALCVEYANPDQGRVFTIIGYQDTIGVYSDNWTRYDLNVWYHNVLEYDPTDATAKWTVYKLGESTPFIENTLTGVPEITNNISYLGGSRYPMLHPWGGGVNPNGIAEARIDNVVLSSPEPAVALSGRIAFVSSDPGAGLFIMNADGSSRYKVPLPYEQLPIVGSPQWSPDGEWLTFHGATGHNGQIYIVRPDGTGFRRVTDGSGNLVEPSFSPDGLQIVFCGPDGRALYIINTDGTDSRRLPVDGSFPKWCPMGDKILYSNWGRTYESDLFLYDLGTLTSTKITTHLPGQAFVYATWSPDATKLAVNVRTAGNGDVWIMNSDGSSPRNLTADWPTSDESWPSWSPDGQYIVFNSDISGNSDIWYTPVDHFDPVNITNSPEDEYIPAIGVPEPVRTYHVDGATGDNTNDGLTRETAFATIQRGINVAEDCETVLVWPGVYNEEIGFWGDAITVKSAADAAVVETDYGYAFSFFSAEGPDTILSNFIIRNSQYGIYLVNGSSPTLSNLTIVNNDFGISAYNGSDPDISNCIFWSNYYGDLFREPVPLQAKYSWIQDGVNEPIAHWKFDEGSGTIAYDSAGDSDGTLYGTPNWVSGISGTALDFDGVGERDYVLIAGQTGLLGGGRFDDLTVEAWIKTSTINDSGPYAAIVADETTDGEFALAVNEFGSAYGVIYMEGSSGAQLLYGPNVTDGDWHHLCLRKDSSEVALFVDSNECDTGASTGPLKVNQETHVTLGCKYTTSLSVQFVGSIDEVAIYDRGLSAEEIEAIYEAGLAGLSYGEPGFVDANGGDYHLLSERGRYWPAYDVWVLDKVTSPCVDGGDPAVDPADEPMPNGGRINMGAYGGTAYASMSEWWSKADINCDGVVDFKDFAIMAESWLDKAAWVEPIYEPPYNWFAYNGHHYALTLEYGTWEQAEAEAVAAGGHLVTINDADENDWLTEFAKDTRIRLEQGVPPVSPSGNNVAWIGYRLSKGEWGWVSGEPVTFTSYSPNWNWYSGVHAYLHAGNHPEAGTWNHNPLQDNVYDQNPRGIIELPW